MTYTAQRRHVQKPIINKEVTGWPKGYVSAGNANDIPEDALADLYNTDLDQDSRPFPRPSTARYGGDFVGICIGIGTFHKLVSGKPERYEISMQAVPTNETQTLKITGTPTGGTFTLTYSGQTTGAIAFSAGATAVQTALEALSNIAVGDVSCSATGSLPGATVKITFAGALADMNVVLITANGAGLTGGTAPAVSIIQTSPGGLQGVVYIRKDGEAWTAPDPAVRYDATAEWATFCHSNNRVLIADGIANLSYLDINAGTIVTYVEVDKPLAPTLTPNGLTTSPSFPYYAAATFFNEAGETDQSPTANVSIDAARESWDSDSQSIDIDAGTLPADAAGTNFYVGTSPGDLRLIASVTGASTFHDDGRSLATITKRAPITNSTGGPILTYLINILGQVFGWGDVQNPSYVWYDGGGNGVDGSGNFTISGGGGYAATDDGGPSLPMSVVSYRTGKGDPTPTIVYGGAPGQAGVRHLSFTPETIGDLTALMPSFSEANGNDGTVSPLATVVANNSIHFPAGDSFKFYGSAPNIPNILSPDNSSDFIQPDVRKLNLQAMHKARSQEYEGRLYFALPVIASENNQIWVLDLKSNPSKWIMPWPIPAKHMWIYQDNGGTTHFNLLVNNKVLEFTRNIFTQDDGVPFRSHCKSGPLKWSKSGAAMGYIQEHYFYLSDPRGTLLAAVNGLGRGGLPIDEFAQQESIAPVENTGWGQYEFGEAEFGQDPGGTNGSSTSGKPVPIKVPVKQTMSQLTWEITTEKANCGYTLGSTFTNGKVIPKLYAGG